MVSSDGKRYATDCFAQENIAEVVKTLPSKRATHFLDWLTYSENSIDGRSKKKAYTFMQSNLVSAEDIGTVKSLQQIHAYLFGGLYDFAGQIRTKTIWKDGTLFCRAEYLLENLGVPVEAQATRNDAEGPRSHPQQNLSGKLRPPQSPPVCACRGRNQRYAGGGWGRRVKEKCLFSHQINWELPKNKPRMPKKNLSQALG